MPDPYLENKTAIKPLIQSPSTIEPDLLSKNINKIGLDKFINILIYNRLASLWLDFIKDCPIDELIDQTFSNQLKNQKIKDTAVLLKQDYILQVVHNVLQSEGISYLVFKGGNLRYLIYDDPIQRSSSDLDILIKESDKEHAIECMVKAGFIPNISLDNISHEITLTKNSVDIDLHWHLLRPGRTRIDLNKFLFENKIKLNEFWGLNYDASLLVMLIHPVFTKYLNSPSSMLIHIVDLHKLVSNSSIDWEKVISMLDKSGTKTAAWSSLYWLQKMTGLSVPREILMIVEPGVLHRQYIRLWLDNNLAKRFNNNPLIVGPLFSLAIQDNITDALHAIRSLISEKRPAHRKMDHLISVNEKQVTFKDR